MVKCMAKVLLSILMVNVMMANGTLVSVKAMECTTTWMVDDMKVNGWMIRFMAKASHFMLMGMSMMGRYVQLVSCR